MFHYRTSKINTAPLSSAATTHFFIISYIFHFCRAAPAPAREKDSNIQKSALLLLCREAKDRLPARNQLSIRNAGGGGGAREKKSRYEAARSNEPGTTSSASRDHRAAAEEGQPLQREPGRDVWILAQTAPESPRTPPGRLFGKNKSPFRAPPLAAIKPGLRH